MSKRSPKSKTPIIPQNLSINKTPRFQSDPSAFYKEKPAWRISHIQTIDPFGWHQVDAATVEKIRERLKAFESMTWDEILNKAGTDNHQIKIDQICKEARDCLSQMQLNDIDEVCSLRVGSIQRLFGILDRGILRLLWWDPNHQICPSTKKHT